jgi:hypothetical protein
MVLQDSTDPVYFEVQFLARFALQNKTKHKKSFFGGQPFQIWRQKFETHCMPICVLPY